MIVGSGMIAKAFCSFADDENIIVYAKGVSNSKETKAEAFAREEKELRSVLLDAKREQTLIYFGTCSVADPLESQSLYVKHKLHMERLVQESGLDHYIFRLPQVVGFTKSPTLVNFLATKIKQGERFDVWKNSIRNLIDIEDVYAIIAYIVAKGCMRNRVINIATDIYTDIPTLVQKIETILQTKACCNSVERGTSYAITIDEILPLLDKVGVAFGADYLDTLLKKYIVV